MLSLLPVTEIPVPRVHVGGRQSDGSLRVLDRPSGESVVVYTPCFTQQFHSGHRAGKWYVRKLTHVGVIPRSRPYPTAKAAVEAVEAGRWALAPAASPSRGLARTSSSSWSSPDDHRDLPA
ncbi:hypothetical protein [Aquisphaera insulae]|uniref:hypothetical protein n=1 Tax=Aquisphaera insulae TaxID=2712864 RepID=UPI0013EB5219|nr:hypothetical protein [Aquisphaera insulae]